RASCTGWRRRSSRIQRRFLWPRRACPHYSCFCCSYRHRVALPHRRGRQQAIDTVNRVAQTYPNAVEALEKIWMNATIAFLEQHWDALLVPLTVIGFTLLLGFAIRNSVFRLLHRWSAGTASKFDDLVIELR